MEEDNVAVLANQVGGEGGKDDARHGSQDCLEGFLVIPETGGGENLGHVNQEDHDAADDEAHPDKFGGGLAPIEFRDGVGDKEREGGRFPNRLYGQAGRWGWIPASVFTGAGSPREKRMVGWDP